MEPRGVGMGWLCMAVLCSGAALILKEDTDHGDDGLELLTDPNTTTGDTEELTTWPAASPTPPWSRGPVTTTVQPQRDAAGNKTRNASALPIKYWSPAIFVVVALLVLFFTYRWTKGEGTRDRAASTSDSSDLGALDATSTPRPAAAQEERKEPEKPRAPECTETAFSEQDPQVLHPNALSPSAGVGGHCPPSISFCFSPARYPPSYQRSPLLRGARCRLSAPGGFQTSPGRPRPPRGAAWALRREDAPSIVCPCGPNPMDAQILVGMGTCVGRGVWDARAGHSRANKDGFHPRTPWVSLLGRKPPPSPIVTFSPWLGAEQRRW
ncbi:uncharacterized protein LOC136004048 isoform X2 [Lathamus discolor]|uniref:uncharacterized protein LOC136004048 isoform X2 n=1 Tax=Lathamus discolor TaxID=678569 RepID=UPI0032B7F291